MQTTSLLRSLHLLSNVPLMVTLLDPEGPVVFQNELSLAYWGERLLPSSQSQGRHHPRGLPGAKSTLSMTSPQVTTYSHVSLTSLPVMRAHVSDGKSAHDQSAHDQSAHDQSAHDQSAHDQSAHDQSAFGYLFFLVLSILPSQLNYTYLTLSGADLVVRGPA